MIVYFRLLRINQPFGRIYKIEVSYEVLAADFIAVSCSIYGEKRDAHSNRRKEIQMKYVLATILSMGVFFNICYADEKLDLKDQKDKESYSLGYQFGQTLKVQGVDINLDVYATGIRDALGGKEPRMNQEEIRAAIAGVQRRVTFSTQKEMREKADKNSAEGKAFLEENKNKEGVKTLPSGLQYKVLVEGSGKIPKATDTVTIHYRGTLINGVEFESSYKKGQPSTFQVNGVIRGWSEGLQLMKEGSKWQLFIPAELAYGERAVGRQILPYSTLIIEVELLSIKSSEPR